jgi:hypothetical protein
VVVNFPRLTIVRELEGFLGINVVYLHHYDADLDVDPDADSDFYLCGSRFLFDPYTDLDVDAGYQNDAYPCVSGSTTLLGMANADSYLRRPGF